MIQYKCGHCRAEMESPDVMKGEVEVCPSCGTLNRVPSKARFGGAVHCARCEKDFSHEDKVKLYNGELVCEKCAAFLEDIEKVTLPEATDTDLASPPPRSVFSGPLGCLVAFFLLVIPLSGFIAIWIIHSTFSLAAFPDLPPTLMRRACFSAVLSVIWFSLVVWVFVQFCKRKRLAPMAILALFIVALLSGFLERDLTLFDAATYFVPWTIWTTLWILYFLFSRRVKETFVR